MAGTKRATTLFSPFRILVEFDSSYKIWVAQCLQTGNLVTADDAVTVRDMIRELMEDEIRFALKHGNLTNLFSNPAPLVKWIRFAIATNTPQTAKLHRHELPASVTHFLNGDGMEIEFLVSENTESNSAATAEPTEVAPEEK